MEEIKSMHKKFIEKDEVQFWIPIITMVVTVTIWGITLSGKIDMLSYRIQKLETDVIEKTQSNKIRLDLYVDALNRFSERLVRLEERR